MNKIYHYKTRERRVLRGYNNAFLSFNVLFCTPQQSYIYICIFILSQKNRKQEDRYLNMFNYTRDFLRENSNIVALRADKGNSTVIMDKSEYGHKMECMV